MVGFSIVMLVFRGVVFSHPFGDPNIKELRQALVTCSLAVKLGENETMGNWPPIWMNVDRSI